MFVKGVSMTTGTVKWFNIQKGFGFIAPDDGGNDARQKVGFELVSDRKSGKMAAENLKALG
jgi:cold shock protein